jgi:succinate dehydrogenase / fumarate reductase membrane anchor subunit
VSVGDSATSLGKVRGLGSAGGGGEHWLSEKVAAAALVLLGAWLIASLLFLPSLDQRTLAEWLSMPSGAVPMALFVITAFAHALHGMKVIVDDYIDDSGNNFAINTLLLFLAVGGAALALFALGKIAFGGEA